MYDIVYSYTFHENCDALIDTICNLFFFNKNQRILAVVNVCDKQAQIKLREGLTGFDVRVILHSEPSRHLYTSSIMKSHVENFKYCLDNDITAKYVILLASNCLFTKQITLHDIENTPLTKVITTSKTNWKWWTPILSNKKIIQSMIDAKYIQDECDLIGVSHEGLIVPFSRLIEFTYFMIPLFNMIEDDTVFEEFLIQTMLSKNGIRNCCKIFWHSPNFAPTLQQAIDEPLPCVKRVSREIDDPVRAGIRNIANNYSH